MGAGNPRKSLKLAGKGVRPGNAVSKRTFAKQEETARPLGVPDMVRRQGQQPGYGLVSDPGMLGRASHGAPEFEQLKARMRSMSGNPPVSKSGEAPVTRSAVPVGAASPGDDYFDLSKYNKVAAALGRPTASSVDDLKRQALRQRQQELARERSARFSSNRRDSRSRFTGDRRPGMVFGPGRSRRMPFRGGFF